MSNPIRWLAASVFFLAGCLMFALPGLARAIMYAGIFSRASFQYPDEVVEKAVPYGFVTLGILALILSAVAILLPHLLGARRPIAPGQPEEQMSRSARE